MVARGSNKPFALIDALNDEWVTLARTSNSTVASWRDHHGVLGECRDVDDVLAALRHGADPVLSALLVEVRGGCVLAARTVLQAMLGKLVLMARRTTSVPIEDFAIALWVRISSYPLERRPTRIAANLALDSLKDARRLAAAELPPAELSLLPPGELFEAWPLRRAGARSPTAYELIVAAADSAVIRPSAAEVMVSVYVEGLSGEHAARRHEVTPELIRYRCSQATEKMRRQLSTVLAAA